MESSQDTEERRPPGRPRNAEADKAILEAALALLAEGGYAGLTIDGVAVRAGVGRPTIYRRWPNKTALVIAALSRSTGLAPAPDTGTLEGDLLAVQDHQVKLMNSSGFRRITPGLVADLTQDQQLSDLYLGQYIAPRRRSVWDALQRGVERGEIDAAPDEDFAFISDLLTGPLFYKALVRGEKLTKQDAQRTVTAVLNTFQTSQRSAPESDR